MFGVFKGLHIKGVAFHQGFNNAMMNTSCKPKFYRILMKLMIDGWREDFQDPDLPVAIVHGWNDDIVPVANHAEAPPTIGRSTTRFGPRTHHGRGEREFVSLKIT